MDEIITQEERQYLFDKMNQLLTEYKYETTAAGLNKILDTWAENKSLLIQRFKTHPNYVPGQFLIRRRATFERLTDADAAGEFFRYIYNVGCISSECGGRGRPDYLLNDRVNTVRSEDGSSMLPRTLYRLLFEKSSIWFGQTLSEELAAQVNEVLPEAHVHAGAKMSRTVNKIMQAIGYATHPDYNKQFAKYSDAINPITYERTTILSINPLDYYTMSFGNSWASCHTIDKENARNMPNDYEGMYSSGTESYMLDESSMIWYTIGAEPVNKEYWSAPKITREVFNYMDYKLLQGRLYPQDNDDNQEVQKAPREQVQRTISELMDIPNYWRVTANYSEDIMDTGTHYRDYYHYSSPRMSYNKEHENHDKMRIGHSPICPYCGRSHNDSDNILCSHCSGEHYNGQQALECYECGEVIGRDSAIFVDDRPYCSNCATICAFCDIAIRYEDAYEVADGTYVCENCINRYYTYCEDCKKYYRNGGYTSCTWVESVGQYVCDNCLDDYFKCDICGKYYKYLSDGETIEIDGVEKWVCDKCQEEL